MQLRDLMEGIRFEQIKGDIDIDISDIAYNSAEVKEGYAFVCIQGLKTDGHKYISQAIKKGAIAIIIDKELKDIEVDKDDLFFQIEKHKTTIIKIDNSRKVLAKISINYFMNPAREFKLVGITGTNGKTTSTYFIKNILESAGYKVGLIGTNQNMIGSEVLFTERTTPESYDLQKLFSNMAKKGVDYVVMEVSSHSIEFDRVYGCKFDVGIFTNISQDHLDFHKNMENYLRVKTKLFEQSKKCAINIDDEMARQIIDKVKCNMITYGIDKKADICAEEISLSENGVIFNLITPIGEEFIEINIPGKFTVYNALSSVAACLLLDIDLNRIKEGLLSLFGVPGRIERVNIDKEFTVLIDYAHTPDGIKNILSSVREFTKARLITLFGCGGDRDSTKRPIMGKIAGDLSDLCIITSDNPRTEDPIKIIKQIEEGIKETSCPYVIIENREKAIEYAISVAQKNDLIILAGKGHEIYQEINGERRHFDEREIVRKYI